MTVDEKLNKIIKSISNIEYILSNLDISATSETDDYGFSYIDAHLKSDWYKEELSELSKLSAELNETVKEKNKDD